MNETSTAPAGARRRGRLSGIGRVLVAVYGVLALAATGRSLVQIVERFDEAPLAYSLSAVAAVVYVLATVALVMPGRAWYRIAWATIVFEFTGVIVVGLLSVLRPDLFPHDTVWSWFGRGYLFVPLVLPPLGMWWLARHPVQDAAADARGAAARTSVDAEGRA
ncbi:hypothetical protein GCM10017608_32340 [Agromyces luteolus]|uniref:Uncharacterized protein n=1 Tax=Agromyces luteolus TaxID=88373 RepID=A0A7C9LX06_9MICO|nr:hypothetical protein [Agromyces luteolus]MUN06537.1 hypothetical protein [Agromyces luteolus]GLK29298.1 hypothetical protein GCM10017608_32340 [Agromyces luteolus]